MNKNMEYPFVAHAYETSDGREWYVEFLDVPGVVGGGKTQVDAVNDAFDNLQAHLEFLEEDGLELPTPSSFPDDTYSGKFALRLSKSMHKRIAMNAKLEGVSINTYINEAIIEKVSTDTANRQFKNAVETIVNVVAPIITQSGFQAIQPVSGNTYTNGIYKPASGLGA